MPEIPARPLETSQESTFDQVKTFGEAMGVNTTFRALTYPDLCTLGGPSIVLLRPGPEGPGYFALVLRAWSGQVMTISAGRMTVGLFDEDEFRLRWSGYALVPQAAGGGRYTLVAPLFLLGLIVPQAIWRRR